VAQKVRKTREKRGFLCFLGVTCCERPTFSMKKAVFFSYLLLSSIISLFYIYIYMSYIYLIFYIVV